MGLFVKIYESKGLVNKLFLKWQMFAYKMTPTNNMLKHIKKIYGSITLSHWNQGWKKWCFDGAIV
jgi:hypothetical protein